MTWEYVAGFFDGEGFLRHRDTQGRLKLEIVIVQLTDNAIVLEMISDFLTEEGVANRLWSRVGRPNAKSVTYLSVSGSQNVYAFLEGVVDHSIVKVDKIVEVMGDIDMKRRHAFENGRSNTWSW